MLDNARSIIRLNELKKGDEQPPFYFDKKKMRLSVLFHAIETCSFTLGFLASIFLFTDDASII